MWRLLLCVLLALTGPALAAPSERPRLVLQVTVDQLRGDLLTRHRAQFGPGGFRRLLEGGVWFANAHYDTSNTVTGAGHAVLATGARTPGHGIVANDWYDRAAGRNVYCVSDPRHPALEPSPRPGAGFSPANLLASTLADEIVAGLPAARAFAVAGKDRGAILMAGRRGRAFWFSDALQGFTTSSFYAPALPGWVEAWNGTRPVEPYRNAEWRALGEAGGDAAANPHARPEGGIGRAFPHPLRARSDALFLTGFKCTPFFDAVIAAFTRELVVREGLGRAGTTDYLAVSFSGQDYIGHAFGPESVEYGDALARLDRELAGLFGLVDRVVGAEHVLIVLSSDHGCADIPEAARARGFEARRLQPKQLQAEWNAQLRARLRVETDLVAAFVPPNVYLDPARVAGAGLEPARVARALAEVTKGSAGVAEAFTAEELRAGVGAPGSLRSRVERSFHVERSGDVVIVQSPFWYLYPDPEGYGAMHGSPYTYDTFVPILLAGRGLVPGVSYRAVTPAQLAPTVAAWLGIKPPSGADGGELLPVFGGPGDASR